MSGVELRHLQALVALTEEGTFTDAAIRLGVTQSAVSRTIVGLETAVGTELVRRTTRTVALTPAGVRTYHAAVRALSAVADVAAAARDTARPLRLGYSWSALGRHTTAVLQHWRTAHPDIALEVHRVDVRDAGLSSGRADVAVVRGDFAADGITVHEVFREPRMAVLPAGHPLAGRVAVRLAELSGETVLTTAYGTTTVELWPVDARPQSILHVDNTDEWLTEIAGGLAIGVTAESTASQHAHPGVVFVPLDDAADIAVHLAWPAANPHPAVRDFVTLVADVVAAA